MKKILLITFLTSISFIGIAQIPTNGLINHYTFDNGTVDDLVGNFNGTNNGATFTKDRFGTDSSALYFDGNASVIFGDINITDPNFTISFWINHNTISNTYSIIGKRSVCSSGNFFSVSLSNNNLGMEVYSGANNNANAGPGGTTTSGKWHHIVLMTDTTNQKTKKFIDGKLVTDKDWGTSVGSIDNSTPLSISNSPCIGVNGTARYQGYIDDIAIYNRPLDSTEVLDLFNISKIDSGVLAYYPFNDQTSVDMSGNNNDGTDFSTSSSQDRFGNANHSYTFDGSTSYISMPSSLINKNELTISMWFKANSAGALIGHQNTDVNTSSNQWAPLLYIREDSTLNARFWNGSTGNTNDSTTNYIDNSWHHVVMIGKSGSFQDIYIDDKLTGTSTGITFLSNMTFNQIGAAYTSGGWPSSPNGWNFFDGDIDDVKIYNRQIMRSEITALFNAENPVEPSIDATVTVSGNTITSNDNGANTTYQWIDCDNSNSSINGATTQSYTATISGSYAVIVTNGMLVDTSVCTMITIDGIINSLENEILLYPNPTTGLITIDTKENLKSINVLDITGRIILNNTNNTINLSIFENGIYFIEVNTKIGRIIKKVVKQ